MSIQSEFWLLLVQDDLDAVGECIKLVDVNRKIEEHVESEDKNKTTPVQFCAKTNQVEMLSLLLQNGALVNCCDSFGYTPLHLACLKDHNGAAKLLIDSGSADLNAVSNRGITALMIAVYRDNLDLVQCILNAGANVVRASQDGFSAVHYAAYIGSIEIITALDKRSNINFKSKDGTLWQDIAVMQGHTNFVNEDYELSLVATNKKLQVTITEDDMPIISMVVDGSDASIVHANKNETVHQQIVPEASPVDAEVEDDNPKSYSSQNGFYSFDSSSTAHQPLAKPEVEDEPQEITKQPPIFTENNPTLMGEQNPIVEAPQAVLDDTLASSQEIAAKAEIKKLMTLDNPNELSDKIDDLIEKLDKDSLLDKCEVELQSLVDRITKLQKMM